MAGGAHSNTTHGGPTSQTLDDALERLASWMHCCALHRMVGATVDCQLTSARCAVPAGWPTAMGLWPTAAGQHTGTPRSSLSRADNYVHSIDVVAPGAPSATDNSSKVRTRRGGGRRSPEDAVIVGAATHKI